MCLLQLWLDIVVVFGKVMVFVLVFFCGLVVVLDVVVLVCVLCIYLCGYYGVMFVVVQSWVLVYGVVVVFY